MDKEIMKWDDFCLIHVGRTYRSFHSFEELRTELSRRGLPMSLADFKLEKYSPKNGFIKNSYQGWSAYAYPPEERKVNLS